MKLRIIGVIVAALVVSLVFAPVALGVSQSTINAIIKDAHDGHLDGHWTKAEVRATLAYVRDNPTLFQYSNIELILERYLAGGQPGEGEGNLSFTGANLLLTFGAGIALLGGGLLLRRRVAA